MSGPEITIRVVTGVLLTLSNAFFVLGEFSLTRLRQLDENEFQDDRRLRRAWQMTERLEFYLTGCQLGITSSSIVLGVVAEPAVTALIRPVMEFVHIPSAAVPVMSVVLAVVAINMIHKVWGEQAPTYLGVERPKQVARYTALPLYWWCKVMYPIIFLGDGLAKATLRLLGVKMTRSWTKRTAAGSGERDQPARAASFAQLRREMGDVLTRGGMPQDRRREVLRALDIDKIPVSDIMVPRREIVALSTEKSAQQNLHTMNDKRRFARFPLVGRSLEDFIGVVYVSDVVRNFDRLRRSEIDFEDLATPPLTVPADMPVSRLIDRFQEQNQELALVEQDNRIVGLVAVTDAFETIAGQVDDPYDTPD